MFEFEKLDMYQLALELCEQVDGVLKKLPKNEYALADQLKRASLSIPLNIAEGCGRWHDKEKKQFFNIARGSVFECVPLLTILERCHILSQIEHATMREILSRLIQMLTKMSGNFSRDRET